MPSEISPSDARNAALKGKAAILDVRHKEEVEFTQIQEKFIWIDAQELPARIAELPRDKEILCLCRTGGRSAGSAEFLNKNGFAAKNIRGGIFEWSKIEPGVKKYVYFFEGEKLAIAEI